MGPEVLLLVGRREEIVVKLRRSGLFHLLRVIAGPRKVSVRETGDDLVPDDRLDRGPADPELPPGILRRCNDGPRRHLGLEDRGTGCGWRGMRDRPQENWGVLRAGK